MWGFAKLDDHSGSVTAVATVVLAFATWSYLKEVQEQRILAERQTHVMRAQLRHLVHPRILIETPQVQKKDGMYVTIAQLENLGGPAYSGWMVSAIICCGTLDELAAGLKDGSPPYVIMSRAVFPEVIRVPALHTEVRRSKHPRTYAGMTDNSFEPGAGDDGNTARVWAITLAGWVIPSVLPVDTDQPFEKLQTFWWNPIIEGWSNMSDPRIADQVHALALDSPGVRDELEDLRARAKRLGTAALPRR